MTKSLRIQNIIRLCGKHVGELLQDETVRSFFAGSAPKNLLFCISMLPRKRLLCQRFATFLLGTCFLAFCPSTRAQQATPAPASPNPPATINTPEFLAAADEVVHDMSKITGWDLKTPLKKSIRSRAEIHAYILHEMDDEKDAKERYASARSAEAFGLIPKGFNLDAFLVDLLTEQIAGLYDPKAHEFYIADWIPVDEQRMVMSHELTHALEDQHFNIEPWMKAARPNDDAEMAREAVLEGSAMAAMLDYELKDKHLKIEDLPDFDPSIFVADLGASPILQKAPPFIKDSLMFPYFSGLTFSVAVLKSGGWRGFTPIFARPPANTQQIIHPDLYFANKVPPPLKLDLPAAVPGDHWVLLEENFLGELGWKEVLKQFLDDARAKSLSAAWDGDVYASFEQKNSKLLMLFARIRLADASSAARFFVLYSEALETKYPDRSRAVWGKDYFAFETPDSSVFFRCSATECISLEGGDAALFQQWLAKLNWPPTPEIAPHQPAPGITTTQSPESPQFRAAALSRGVTAYCLP